MVWTADASFPAVLPIQSAKWLDFETNQSPPPFPSAGFLLPFLFDPENGGDIIF
jgi:hypothetical protein